MEKKKLMKKVLKIALIVVAILLIILVINTIRNYVIVTDLQNKIAEYSNSTNYHIKSVLTENNGTIVKMDYYEKGDKQVVILERNVNNEITKVSMYNNGERTDTFTETNDSKIVKLDSGTIMSVNIYNHLETENKWQTLIGCISAKIKLVDYNGKKCYIVKDFMSSTSLVYEDAETYIDKETGLFVKSTESDIVNEREYEFDMVDDSIFVEPDVGQYKIKLDSEE